MRLRIAVEIEGVKMRISVAGELIAEGIPALREAVGASASVVEFDLSNLMFADVDGVAALRRLIDEGATVTGASLFIESLLSIR